MTRDTISLDQFFRDKEITFIKADIEGFEKEMLTNAKNTFEKKVKKALLVMYHKKEDEAELSRIMSDYGFSSKINRGYMLLYFSPNFVPPYIRRGVICFER